MKKLITIILLLSLSQITIAQEINASLLKNLSPEQIAIARNELNKTKPISSPKPKVNESTVVNFIDDDVTQNYGTKFGYSFFSTSPTSVAALGDLPIPNDYKISLQDQFTVILSGSKELIFDLDVKLDGSIFFPDIGPVYVFEETFEDVKLKIKNLVNQSYIGVRVDLSLKNLSAKKITIVGAVNTPGTYIVNPFTTVSNALAYAGGIQDFGTLRNIKLVRKNGQEFNFDLYKLLIDGDRANDITIEAGDVIIIGAAGQFVDLSGAVKRPAVYEVKPEEKLDDLIQFGLGFTELANKSNINVEMLDLDKSAVKNLKINDLSLNLKNVIGVDIYNYINKDISSVWVNGAVKEPGYYSIQENATLEELISNIEFIDVYPWLAVLEQFDSSNLIKESILFNLKDPNTYRSVKLLPNSKIYFSSIDSMKFNASPLAQQLIDDYKLTLNHKNNTYKLPVYGRFKVSAFVDFLGLDMSDIENEATYISPLNNIIINDDYKNMQFIASKYNTVSFRSLVNDLISVTIRGEIDYPGTYTLKPETSLEELYNLIGAFKKEAYLEGIILTRESIRARQINSINKIKNDLNESLLTSIQKGENIGDINIIKSLNETINPENLGRIAGNFVPESPSSINTILFDGDSIIVPKNPNVITVLGAVINPLSFEYQSNTSIKMAIESSGGYGEVANKRGVYVIRANGLIEKSSRNIFVKSIKLNPGDTVVVPRKIITNNLGLDALLPVTQIMSDLAFSAAALENLKN
ncbi:SLBB domain-containing protein [Gammaproteobacteria bacterium]|nr:SLBB domain-containing protein [Gammaproteobacteria bacterium]